MKKKMLSLLLTLALLGTVLPVPTAAAEAEDSAEGFLMPVTYELPAAMKGGKLIEGGEKKLPDPMEEGFIGKLSGPMPEIREDGFLAKPSAPIKSFPDEGELMAEVGEPDPEAVPIATADELQSIPKAGGSFVLTADIDLSGMEWDPIDINGDEAHIILDGQGHTISGLTVTNAGEYYSGLFSSVKGPLTVRNLIMEDVSLTAVRNMGAIAGEFYCYEGEALIENCVVSGVTFNGTTQPMGGFIGSVEATSARDPSETSDVTFRNCAVTLSHDTNPEDEATTLYNFHSIGGLAGTVKANNVTLEDCLTDVTFDLTMISYNYSARGSGVGGLLGDVTCQGDLTLLRCGVEAELSTSAYGVISGMINDASAKNYYVTDCSFNGTLTFDDSVKSSGSKTNSQGCFFNRVLVGHVVFDNCRASGEVINLPSSNGYGALFGNTLSPNVTSCTVRNCLNTVDVEITKDFYAGGLIGKAPAELYMVDCLNTGDLTAADGEAKVSVGGLVGYIPQAENAYLQRCENQGRVAGGGLVALSVDGKQPLTLEDCKNSGTVNGAGLVSKGDCTMTNCLNVGQVGTAGLADSQKSADCKYVECRSVGSPLVVSSVNGTFIRCSAKVPEAYSVYLSSAYSNVCGGIMRTGSGMLESCTVFLALTDSEPGSTYQDVGGLVGSANGPLEFRNCQAIVELEAAPYRGLGGLVGCSSSSTYPVYIYNCSAEVEIDAHIGRLDYYGDEVHGIGGLIGYSIGPLTIEKSYTTGSIGVCLDQECMAKGEENRCYGTAGGLAGKCENVTIGQCYSSADLEDAYQMGGLVGSATGGVIYSSWTDSTLSLDDALESEILAERSIVSYCMGGLVGSTNVTLTDCCFLGTIVSADAGRTGGIAGAAYAINNCYSAQELLQASNRTLYGTSSGPTVGGLAGSVGLVQNSTFNGTVKSLSGTAGGIAGSLERGSDLRSSAWVYGDDAGGIAGSAGTLENCFTDGFIEGRSIGSIASAVSNIYSCTTNAYLSAPSGGVVGGIVGTLGGTMDDCHYPYHLQLTTSGGGSTIGGLVGSADDAQIRNSSSQGVSWYCYERASGNLGGIVGSCGTEYDETILENCRVEGRVYFNAWPGTVTPGTVRVAGLAAYAYQYHDVYMSNCVVAGNITAYVNSTSNEGSIYVGGLFGETNTGFAWGGRLYLENNTFNGELFYTDKYVDKRPAYCSHPLAGYAAIVHADVPEIVLPEKDPETYTVKVTGFSMTGETVGSDYPMEGIPVYADSTLVGTSDANGIVKFKSSDVSRTSAMVWLNASKEGYFEARVPTFLADGGSTWLSLKEKIPGEIYFKNAILEDKQSGIANLLSHLTDVQIPLMDQTPRPLTVSVDWNDLAEENRELYLCNDYKVPIVRLTNGETEYVNFSEKFEVGDTIFLMARGYHNGTLVEKCEPLKIKIIDTEIDLKTEKGQQDVGGSGDKDDNAFLYFLRGLQIGLNFGDLTEYAAGISFKDGVITIKFGFSDKNKKTVSVWTGFSEKVKVEGTIKVPLDEDAEGSGSITASINDGVKSEITPDKIKEHNKDAENNKDKKAVNFDFYIGGVPCFLETALSVGGKATFGIKGKITEAETEGSIEVNGAGSIFGGIGKEFTKKLEFKFGGEGELGVELPMKFDTSAEQTVELDPELKGDINAKASVKAYFVEVEEKLRLGGFVWNKKGADWTWLDEEPDFGPEEEKVQLQGMARIEPDDTDWVPMSRDYLANGGGFYQDQVSLLGFDSAANQTLRYSNISELSETALGYENGQPVLYYTADDESPEADGIVAQHTALWRTVRQSDGSWSEPTIVNTDGGYPASPHAAGPFVVWVESAETDSLDELLQSTKIKVALNGELIHTFETDGYVYDPKIAVGSSGETAAVSWISDPEVSKENLLGGETELQYSKFSNGTWGRIQKKYVNTLSAQPYKDLYTYYLNSSGQLQTTASSSTYSTLSGKHVYLGSVAAMFDSAGQLKIYNGTGNYATLQTGYTGSDDPVMVEGNSNCFYLFWPETDGIHCVVSSSRTSWSQPILAVPTTGLPRELNAVVIDGVPHLVYLQTEGNQTNMYTAVMANQGPDLVLSHLSCNEQEIVERGYITMVGEVFNNGLTAAEAISVNVKDETGAEVYTHTFSKEVTTGGRTSFMASFAPDGLKPHTYTVSITPVVDGTAAADSDPSDNSTEIVLGLPSAKIMDAHFSEAPDGSVQLETIFQNTGTARMDATVEIRTRDGATLIRNVYQGETAIPSASMRQTILQQPVPNTYYEIEILSGDQVLDSVMLMYQDPDAKILSANSVELLEGGRSANAAIWGQNQDQSGRVILALYENDAFAAFGMETVRDFNGEQTITLALSKPLTGNAYTYKLFYLSEDARWAPLAPASSGTIRNE